LTFETVIVEYPAKRLVGMKVRTNMQSAMEDCYGAWNAFMPRMAEVNGEPEESFGVSVMINENDFDYWTALEATTQGPLPDGMQVVNIASGTYVRCTVPNMEKLGDAYIYLYTTWNQSQSHAEYVLDMEVGSFERYPCDWQPDTPFEIYAPLKKS